jgi:predicted transcriptional regulator
MKDSNNKAVSKKTLELLTLITPGPLGQGLTQKAAAQILGITEKAVFNRLKTFEKNFPESYQRFKCIKKLSRETRDSLHNTWSLEDFEGEEKDFEIKEKW